MSGYDVHGVGLRVEGDGDALGGAVERRLRSFASSGAALTTDLRLRFVEEHDGAMSAPAGESRVIYESPGVEVVHYGEEDVLCADLEGVRLRADLATGVAQIASTSFTGRARYLAAHPLTTFSLLEMLKRRGLFSLHAACLARDGRAVVVAGTSGAGKSTLALSLARAGLDYLSDDMLLFRREDDDVVALAFADTVGVTEPTAARLPELSDLPSHGPEAGFPKHLIRIEDRFDVSVATRATPVALVFPEVVPGAEGRLEPLDPAAAWLRLVPDVLLTEPASTQAHLDIVAALTKQVRCYSLRAGADLDANAELVAGLL